MGAFICVAGLSGPLAGCGGVQSALEPAGRDAETLADLFWVLLAGAIVLWLLVNGLFIYVARLKERRLSRWAAETLIIGGGIIFPLVTLGALLAYSLSIMPDQRAAGSGLTVKVTGHQWWWRVEYWPEGASEPIVSANEIRLPAGARTEIALTANKVIHSFWIPALAGKMDMFPGRATRMAVEPLKTGKYRGQCAEFCGASHARMAFEAVVMEPAQFNAWLEREAGNAIEPETQAPARGKEVFLSEGCGACHTVRGTPARGRTGPDLTHVGGRTSLAAGILPVTAEAFQDWVRHAEGMKPAVEMPSFRHLGDGELADLSHFLKALK